MAQHIQALAVRPDDLRSVPEFYMVEGEKQLWSCSLASTCGGMLYPYPEINKHDFLFKTSNYFW